MTIRELAIQYSRELRKSMTPAEKLFWQEVRKKKLNGYKFLRQHPLFYKFWEKKKFFIADFYCRPLKLVVEIDGGIHERQKDYDKRRSEILEWDKDLRIIRFKNEEVIKDLPGVINRVKQFM